MKKAGFDGKRITRTHFNRKSQVCNIVHILMGEASWNQQDKTDNQESFRWEITGLQYLAYLNRKKYRAQWEIPGLQYLAFYNSRLNLREGEFNGKSQVYNIGHILMRD